MIINTTPDKEKVKSILKMVKEREVFIDSIELTETSSTIISENYYEIIKELGVAILLLDGKRTVGEYAHKEVIEYLRDKRIINNLEYSISDDLRIKRNYSSYEGKRIPKDYISSRKEDISKIIKKLKDFIENYNLSIV